MRIVDTTTMPWQNGIDAINSMPPEWRNNLGPADKLAECYSKYDQKSLRLDADTTRRLDLVRLAPGYADLTDAYHDSVEECFCLEGSCWLSGEGTIAREGYFWRPPGWIHGAVSEQGFTALLGLQGISDESGLVTRRIRPRSEAGTNALFPHDPERAVGKRGWVRMLDSRTVVWQPGRVYARAEEPLIGFDLDHVEVKVLSKNPFSGAQTLLLRLAPGYQQGGPGCHTAGFECFVIRGSITSGETPLNAGAYLQRDPGATEPALASDEGALLYAKVDGWLDFNLG